VGGAYVFAAGAGHKHRRDDNQHDDCHPGKQSGSAFPAGLVFGTSFSASSHVLSSICQAAGNSAQRLFERFNSKMIRAADAKEVGMGNPAEETCRHPNL
jgi:hypothetical protein